MFNPEKLLGGMLRSGGRRGGGLGSLMSGGGAALGLVGVAMEAVEHYMNKSGASGSAAPPPAPGKAPGASMGGAPPPPPGRSAASPPPPPAAAVDGGAARHDQAVLLIRAMIAAANADGVIDADERARILEKLQSVELSREEHAFITNELLDPKPVQELIGTVQSVEQAQQVYAASVLAIEADTPAEQQYLKELAHLLKLDHQAVADIHQQLDVAIL